MFLWYLYDYLETKVAFIKIFSIVKITDQTLPYKIVDNPF